MGARLKLLSKKNPAMQPQIADILRESRIRYHLRIATQLQEPVSPEFPCLRFIILKDVRSLKAMDSRYPTNPLKENARRMGLNPALNRVIGFDKAGSAKSLDEDA